MSRKAVVRDLPPLVQVIRDFKGFRVDEDRHARMEALLADAVRRLRRGTRRTFYSMRSVAQFFGVSLRTTARVYRRLQSKGLLLCARSSATVLNARQAHPRVVVRGVVGLPIWYPGFALFQEWRAFFLGLEAALRKHGFAADLIFYGQSQELQPGFVDRIVERNPDCVFWARPVPADMPVILSMRDAGLPVVIMTALPTTVPGRYVLSEYHAWLRGLQAWREAGVVSVQIAREGPDTVPGEPRELEMALRTVGLPYRYRDKVGGTYTAHVAGLAQRSDVGVVFESDIWIRHLCQFAPSAMLRLLRRARVMATNTPLLPGEGLRGLRVDRIELDWIGVATLIADDFGREEVLSEGNTVRIDATWRPGVLVADEITRMTDL